MAKQAYFGRPWPTDWQNNVPKVSAILAAGKVTFRGSLQIFTQAFRPVVWD
jgi:hypothetical protein